MAQIVVRGIAETDLKALDRRARRLGRSREQEVRELIARAAAEERSWRAHVRQSGEWRRRLADRTLSDAAGLIRRERERR